MWALLVACGGSPDPETVGPDPAADPDPAAEPVVALALGESTTCTVAPGDRVRCVGRHPLAPTRLAGALTVTDTGVCARARGRVRCVREGHDSDAPTAFVELGIGSGGAGCGRDADGGVWCFDGEVEVPGATLRPVALPAAAVRLVASLRTWALLADGTLWSFDPYAVRTGTGAARPEATGVAELDGELLQACWRTSGAVTCVGPEGAAPVPGLSGATAIAVGSLHGCALRDGVPWCWARSTDDRAATPVPGVTGAVAIDAGSAHTCALLGSVEVRCWSPGDAVALPLR